MHCSCYSFVIFIVNIFSEHISFNFGLWLFFYFCWYCCFSWIRFFYSFSLQVLLFTEVSFLHMFNDLWLWVILCVCFPLLTAFHALPTCKCAQNKRRSRKETFHADACVPQCGSGGARKQLPFFDSSLMHGNRHTCRALSLAQGNRLVSAQGHIHTHCSSLTADSSVACCQILSVGRRAGSGK